MPFARLFRGVLRKTVQKPLAPGGEVDLERACQERLEGARSSKRSVAGLPGGRGRNAFG